MNFARFEFHTLLKKETSLLLLAIANLAQCRPTERTWPEKCIRCVSKGLPCSESKRTERKSKYSTATLSSPGNIFVEDRQMSENRTLLQQWYVKIQVETKTAWILKS
jgi:hypothetical protein